MSGAGRQTLLLSIQLRNRGHKITILAPAGALQKKSNQNKIEFMAVRMRSYLDREADHKIRAILCKLQPDIVHCHGMRGGWMGRLASRKLNKIAVIYTEYYLTNETMIKNLVWRKFILKGLGYFNKFTDVTITSSNAIKKFLINHKLSQFHKTFVIPELIERKYITASCFRKPQGIPLIIGTVGSFTHNKGYVFLLDSLRELQKMKINADWRCQIVGAGQLEKPIKKIIKKYKLSRAISLLGRAEDLMGAMRHFTCYVQSSISEPFGSITARAMALGIPPVVSQRGGLVDLVNSGTSGIVVPYGRPIIMAQALKEILENEKVRNEMARSAKQHAKTFFDPRIVTSRIEQTYERALRIRKFKNPQN